MLQNNLKNRVAVVVVTYNRLEFLKRCVDSLHKQTVPCDILVVDNASTDETAQWLESQTDIFFFIIRGATLAVPADSIMVCAGR